MKKKNKGGRPPAAVSERRKRTAIKLLGEGHTQRSIAEQIGVTPVTVCRNLKELRETMATATQADFETYRKGQLAILELIEENLLNGAIPTDVAGEWRRVRSDITKLMGWNAPERSVSINVEADSSKLVGYRKFVAETQYLSGQQLEEVYKFARSLSTAREPIEVHFLPEAEYAE